MAAPTTEATTTGLSSLAPECECTPCLGAGSKAQFWSTGHALTFLNRPIVVSIGASIRLEPLNALNGWPLNAKHAHHATWAIREAVHQARGGKP